VYREAPSFRPDPGEMTSTQARGDRVVSSIVHFTSQAPVRDNHSYKCSALDASRAP